MSYFLISVVLFFLILNVVFRVKIIKKYKALNNKQINIDPRLMFDKPALEQFVKEAHPDYAEEIHDFRRSLNRLLVAGLTGLVVIIVVYLLIKFV